MGIMAEGAEAVVWAHHLLPITGAPLAQGLGGSGTVLHLAGLDLICTMLEVWWSAPGALVNSTPPALS